MKHADFTAGKAYPPVCAGEQNPMTAQAMLSNIGSANSEMSAVSLYFYNHLVTADSYEELSSVFHEISVVEMHHLEIFAALAKQSGADPRLWCRQNGRMVYWSPGFHQYPRDLNVLMNYAIQSERQAVEKYRRQCEKISNSNIQENLSRIILDEERHIEILETMRNRYGEKGSGNRG